MGRRGGDSVSTFANIMAAILLLTNGAIVVVCGLLVRELRLDVKRTRKRWKEAAPAIPTIPRFATISECLAASVRLTFLPGDRIGCAHCPWTGNSAPKFASHLLTCPDGDTTNERNHQ